MKALVTGATGLIGNAIARALIERGDDVRVLVRDRARAEQMLPDPADIIRGDLTEREGIDRAVRNIDVVFHAGGLPEQWARDATIFDRTNRQGTANVLEAALAAGVKRVVYTSTMDVFREDADGRLRETAPDPNPKPSAYERSKQLAEREADRVRAAGLEVVFLNPSSVYGPSPVVTGMNVFFMRMLMGKVPMVPPGGASLAYVDAVANAHLAAAERGVDGERYLLADAHVTMEELARITARVAGLGKTPKKAPAFVLKTFATVSAPLARTFGFKPMVAPDELGFLLWNADVDSTKAQQQLGYMPVPIEEGVARTIAHMRTTGLAPA
ncbi:MAG: SDR family NAD(P)-dependent oxidoreductase [Actinomycetota bacterium]|nr:SDR family NAD(P)-dependent oxidoreductase [Actinomycetota bacterium]